MRVGLVGAGSMGRVHAAAWRAAGAQLVGVAALDAGAAGALAAEHGARAVGRLEELLPGVDVVDLCVPTDLHRPLTELAAAAGKHVVCEKPIALSLEDGRAMIATCDSAGVRLFVAMVVRFFPQYRLAHEIAASGRLGDLGVVRLKRAGWQPRMAGHNWYLDSARSGGMVVDLMVHDFDYARWLCGEVERVYCRSARSLWAGAPADYALATLRFASGAMALIEGSWAYPPGVFRTALDISGTGGALEWDSDSSATLRSFLDAPVGEAGVVGLPLSPLAEDPYAAEIRHVRQAIESGEPFLVTPEDALEALRVALAARRSLETGRAVSMTEVV